MVNCSFYYSDFKGTPSKGAEFIVKTLPRDWKMNMVFRYKFKFLNDDTKYSNWTPFFLYDNFTDLTEEDMTSAEKKINTAFNTIRVMNKVAFLRYPRTNNLPSDEYLANLVNSWVKFFIERKIDLFITTLIDETPGYVGLEVARALKIPTIILCGSKFSDSYILCDAYYQPIFYKKMSKKDMEESYKKAVDLTKGTSILNKDFSKVAKKMFSITAGSMPTLIGGFFSNFKAFYFEIPKQDRNIWYSTGELVRRQIKYFLRSMIANRYFSEDPDYSENYMLFPLHFIDDASITVRAPFIDQFNLIEDISRTLRQDVVLYVKPHPHWRCMDIPLDVMRKLRRLPNVKLLKYSTNTKELIKHSNSVVVINSTVGFEALVYDKPVFTFGDDYPDNVAPHIDSMEQMLDLEKMKVNQKSVKEFITKHYFHTIFQKNPYYLTLDFENEDDVRAIVSEIEKAYSFVRVKK